MDKYISQIFKNKRAVERKLSQYGFAQNDGAQVYSTAIMDGQFQVDVKIFGGKIETAVTDVATDEPYTLFLAEDAVGGFVGEVREQYESLLLDICKKCFEKHVFKSECSQKVIAYVYEKYGDELEFLWEKFDDNAVLRRKDTDKWYAVLGIVAKDRIGINSKEKGEMIILRADPQEAEKIVDNVRIFKGYHMNKKRWITICLDGSLPEVEIFKRIDDSYALAKK